MARIHIFILSYSTDLNSDLILRCRTAFCMIGGKSYPTSFSGIISAVPALHDAPHQQTPQSTPKTNQSSVTHSRNALPEVNTCFLPMN